MDDKRKLFTDQMLATAANENSPYLLTDAQYCQVINEFHAANEKTTRKTMHEYRLLERYSIIKINDSEKLIQKQSDNCENVLYVVPIEQMYDKLLEIHLATGHGGRDRLIEEVKKKYCGITKEAVMNFISYCEECQLKRKKAKKGLVVEPIVSNVMNSRYQVDLIDTQSEPDGNYKFIMVYQDHLTKFVQLRALEHKTAKQVAEELYRIFCTFGAPCILQSDNGREFANSVVSELLKRWPGCKMVHGKPRHRQSQGSVERANQDVRNMLVAWSRTKKSTHWAEALWDIQFSKNRSLHHGIRRSPYEAMFGRKPRVELLTSFLPDDIVQSLETEEDLESAIDEFSMTSYESNVNDVNTLRSTDTDDVNNTTGDANDQVDQLQPMTINECDSCHEEKANGELEACKNCKLLIHSKPPCGYLDENDVLCSLCQSEKRIADQRNGAKRKLAIHFAWCTH